ncbi:hypothetical protein BAE44_0006947 [Dichanthelium oligosanthes]|uniref:Uncharacterized protein n=1 Tax=Dichanthelium oligosanthes TaxID=888268 RepID=A0A1E5W3Z7_9POAL|nr:hypothetical protein BAE44_0006947 [Dichanthelium oligosanthes]
MGSSRRRGRSACSATPRSASSSSPAPASSTPSAPPRHRVCHYLLPIFLPLTDYLLMPPWYYAILVMLDQRKILFLESSAALFLLDAVVAFPTVVNMHFLALEWGRYNATG